MTRKPERTEAAAYYFKYIDRVGDGDVVSLLATQMEETTRLLAPITEEKSLYRYAADKWSLRQTLSHVTDTERLFLFRAFWFARKLEAPLPSFDQDVAAAAAGADDVAWAAHVEDFRTVRASALSFFRGLPQEAWTRMGIASDNPFSVRALAYIIAGHADHHAAIVRERYL